MINLKKLEFYLRFHDEIEEFLYKRCIEYNKAKSGNIRASGPMGDLQKFEFEGNSIRITFRYWECESTYDILPLDILFDDDFYEKMKIRFAEIRRREEEREKVIEINKLKALMKKYPEEGGLKN